MNALVSKLCQGNHPVEISIRPQPTVKALKECIDRGYVHVKFTQTRGGTELGFSLDKQETDLSGADFEAGSGFVRLAGKLKLDYVPVKCFATVDLASLAGEGHLVAIKE